MKVVDKRMVFINSNERDSGNINNFTITLPPHLLKRRKNQKMRIVLNDLVLPYTWFNVQTTNRSFHVRENNAGSTFEVFLQPGSYHVVQLRDHLKQQLDYYSGIYGDNYVYTIVYQEVSGQFTFAASKANGVASVEFHFSSASAHKLLGFASSSVNIFSNQTLASTQVVNMMYTDALYLHCDLPTTNVDKGSGDQSIYHLSSTFAKIPVNTSPFNNIIYTNINDDFVTNIPDEFINSMRFHFHSLNHQEIDLNDDYSLTLKLEILEDDEHELLKQTKINNELLRTLLLQQHVKK